MDQTAIVDRFIEVNKKLFALCDEAQAQAHIASLSGEATREMARSLWGIEKCERALREPAADHAQPRGDEGKG